MADALVGWSGCIGSALLRQRPFQGLYRSTDIGQIADQEFELVVCAGAPAQKWLANREPEADRVNLQRLMDALSRVRCQRFILISTVDVFREPSGVDETSPVPEAGLHAYGLHRRALEKFVAHQFPDHLIVRLSGLVGPGLRKNVLFDFLNGNALEAIDSRAVYQFYPLTELWSDLRKCLETGVHCVHLCAAPVSVAEAAEHGFGSRFEQSLGGNPARYDVRSVHAPDASGAPGYAYSKEQSLAAIRNYARSEPRTVR